MQAPSTLTLSPQHARGLIGGRVDFRHYLTSASYSHYLWFTSPVTVTKRMKTIVFSPATGFSGGFSWEVDAVGFDSQSNQLFTVSSALVPIPADCP